MLLESIDGRAVPAVRTQTENCNLPPDFMKQLVEGETRVPVLPCALWLYNQCFETYAYELVSTVLRTRQSPGVSPQIREVRRYLPPFMLL